MVPFEVDAFVVTLAAFCPAQERFETGWLKGFTKSPTEHIINEPENPFTIRSVKGVVLDPSGVEMGGVVVEIRDEAGRIRGTQTNRNGTFRLGGVPKGRYKFTVTMNGFQSVVGDVVVTKKASKADQINRDESRSLKVNFLLPLTMNFCGTRTADRRVLSLVRMLRQLNDL